MAFGGLKGTLIGTVNNVGTSLAFTTGGPVTVVAGDLVYVAYGEQLAASASACADNLGNTYAATQVAFDAGTIGGRAFWARVTNGGSLTTITLTTSSSTNNAAAVAAVIEGPFALSPLDTNPTTIEDISSPYTGPATGTLAQAEEAVLSWIIHTGAVTTFSATSPNLKANQQVTQAILTLAVGYQAVAATTTVSPAWTSSSGAPTDAVNGTNSFMRDLRPPHKPAEIGQRIGGVWPVSLLTWLQPKTAEPEAEAEYVLPSPQEMWVRAPDSRVALGTHLRSGTTALLIPAPEPEELLFGTPVEQWMRPVDRRVAIIAQPLGYLPGEVAAPIRPLDWPVIRAPARAQTWVNDNRLILVGEDVLPHGPFDWPNPYIIRSAVSLRTWINDNRLLLVGQDQLPGRQPDWPVPRGAIAHPDLYAWTNRLTTGAFLSPFAQLDWPVPKGREFPRSLLTWTAKGQIEVEVFPFRQTEWPNPLTPVWAERGWIVQTKLNLIGQDLLPHGPFDWPNPRGPTYPVSLRTWTEIYRLHGQDQFFGLAGHPNFDWPVPRGASRRPQDWQQGFRVVDQEAQFPPAGSIYDWPNPRGATYPVSLRTWTDQVRKQLIGQDALPHRQRDWPVPRGAARRPAQHSWVQRALAFAVAPVRPVDWPNPRAAADPVSLRTWIDQAKGLLAPAAQLTLQAKDWPNPIRPRSAAYQVEYPPGTFFEEPQEDLPSRKLDWPNPRGPAVLAYLIEYTTSPSFIVLPSSGGRGDWPNPLGPVYPVSLRTWSERYRLHGQDQFFGLAGHPNYDWPVPKGPKLTAYHIEYPPGTHFVPSVSNQLVQIVIIGD